MKSIKRNGSHYEITAQPNKRARRENLNNPESTISNNTLSSTLDVPVIRLSNPGASNTGHSKSTKVTPKWIQEPYNGPSVLRTQSRQPQNSIPAISNKKNIGPPYFAPTLSKARATTSGPTNPVIDNYRISHPPATNQGPFTSGLPIKDPFIAKTSVSEPANSRTSHSQANNQGSFSSRPANTAPHNARTCASGPAHSTTSHSQANNQGSFSSRPANTAPHNARPSVSGPANSRTSHSQGSNQGSYSSRPDIRTDFSDLGHHNPSPNNCGAKESTNTKLKSSKVGPKRQGHEKIIKKTTNTIRRRKSLEDTKKYREQIVIKRECKEQFKKLDCYFKEDFQNAEVIFKENVETLNQEEKRLNDFAVFLKVKLPLHFNRKAPLKTKIENVFKAIGACKKSINELRKELDAEDAMFTKRLIQKLKNQFNLAYKLVKETIPKVQKVITKHKQNVIKKTNSLENPKTVKRQTVKGDEYQRILQILLRQRALTTSNSETGIEVSGVGQLDDVVIIETNRCRFFQIKHSTNKVPIKVTELLKEPKIEDDTAEQEANKKKSKQEKSNLNLLLYFKSFCKIKENEKFENCTVREITFITNREIVFDRQDEDMNLLFELDDKIREDEIYFNGTKAKKYKLNVEKMKTKFGEILRREATKYLEEKKRMAPLILEDFLKQIRVIVNYPDLDEFRRLTFNEVFSEDIFQSFSSSREIFETSILYVEIKLLQIETEFITNKTWSFEITKLKGLIYGLKATGVTDLKTRSASSDVNVNISLESIKDIHNSLKKLILEDEHFILECKGQNLNMTMIKIIRIFEHMKKHENNIILVPKFIFCDYDDLVFADFLIEAFVSGEFSLLILVCKKNTTNELTKESIDKLLNTTGHKKKIILISEEGTKITNSFKERCKGKYIEEEYNHGFRNLSQSCKNNVLAEAITFQNNSTTLGHLVNEELANIAIDETCLWEIAQNARSGIDISNQESFCSSGYDETYYIPRKLYQNELSYRTLKNKSVVGLVFMTGEYGMDCNQIKKSLEGNGVSSSHIQLWQNDKKFEKGIVLTDDFSTPPLAVFENISKFAPNVQWLSVNKNDQLFFVKSLKVKNFAENQSTRKQTLSEEELDLKKLGNTVVLVGNSGVGKSTMLTSIANKIRKEQPNTWIAKINMRKAFLYSTLERDCSSPEKAIENVIKMVLMSGSCSNLVKNILREGLKKSFRHKFNFVLLLDGYNEVNESLQENTIKLIKTLRNHCNVHQIWVTTQKQEQVKLESSLEVAAYILKPLMHKDRVRLMVQYWKFKYGEETSAQYTDEELVEDANEALKEWERLICDKEKQQFTENALNLIMLAEVLSKSDRKIGESLMLLNLYDAFVQHKFSLHRKESSPSQSITNDIDNNICVNTAKDKLFEGYVCEILQELSVSFILNKYKKNFNKDDFEKLAGMRMFQQFQTFLGESESTLTLTKLGLLNRIEESNKLDFIHFTFAQYFFSKYLILNLWKLSSDIKTFFVQHVYTDSSLQPCRRFLNKSLEELENLRDPNTEEQIANKGNLTRAAIKILLQKTRNSSVPILENFQYVVLLLLNWLNDTDYNRYLEKVLKDDFKPYASNKVEVDEIINCLKETSKEKASKILIKLNQKKGGKGKSEKYKIIEVLNELKGDLLIKCDTIVILSSDTEAE